MTDDGGEMDLDLGNYERYLLTTLTRDHNITVSEPFGDNELASQDNTDLSTTPDWQGVPTSH